MNWEIPNVRVGFRKGRVTRDQIANICWIIKKAREFRTNICFSLTGNTKTFDWLYDCVKRLTVWLCIMIKCVEQDKLWKTGDRNIRSSYLSPEKPVCGSRSKVRTVYGTIDWFKIEKEVWQGCWLSPCVFNLYAEHIMRNARVDELQAGIKIAETNTWRLNNTFLNSQ